jgi:hypothetical protein
VPHKAGLAVIQGLTGFGRQSHIARPVLVGPTPVNAS